MRFAKPNCPECGRRAYGIHEDVPVLALIDFDDDPDGDCDEVAAVDVEAEYAGESKVGWDGQTPVIDDAGRVTLACRNGHEWRSLMSDGGNTPLEDLICQKVDELAKAFEEIGAKPLTGDEKSQLYTHVENFFNAVLGQL